VPVVYQVQMGLLAFNNSVYAIEVGGESATRRIPPLPIEGCGIFAVDHNYGGPDNLAYRSGTNCAIEGAYVYVFRQSDYVAAQPAVPNMALAVANTTTAANGRWTTALKLDPGDYALLFEKPGEYGPDIHFITVTPPPALRATPTAPPVVISKYSPKPEKSGSKEDFWNV
jgi:hypothetical protein